MGTRPTSKSISKKYDRSSLVGWVMTDISLNCSLYVGLVPRIRSDKDSEWDKAQMIRCTILECWYSIPWIASVGTPTPGSRVLVLQPLDRECWYSNPWIASVGTPTSGSQVLVLQPLDCECWYSNPWITSVGTPTPGS